MHIKHIHEMVEKLASCAHHEFEKGIENIDTEEMGKVADILKDLAEAEYYSKISKAMDESEYGEDYDVDGPMEERRYYRGQPRDSRGRYMSRRGRRGYVEPNYHMTPEMYKEHDPEYWRDMDRHEGRMYYTSVGNPGGSSGMSGGNMGGNSSSGGTRNYGGEMGRDYREGHSGQSRRSYMEAKEAYPGNSPEDKQKKTKELEKYMNELSSDITEMISNASNEEKTMLKAKLNTIAQKVV